jgi:cytochrome b561
MTTTAGYSRTQISLHWLVAALILFQMIFGEEIGSAFDAMLDSGVASYGLAAITHIAAGVGVLLFALWRLALRFTRGVPAGPAGESLVQGLLAKGTHAILYLMMIVVPVVGLYAWFGGSEEAGDLHSLAKPAFIIFVGLHVLGALYHQFVLKDGLLRRMMRAGG